MASAYPDNTRMRALALLKSNGYPGRRGALTATAQATGISRACLVKWHRGERRGSPDPAALQAAELDLSKVVRNQLAVVNRALLDKIEEASYRDLAVMMGILLDKALLLSGKPTQRVETITGMLDSLSEDEYQAVVEEARALLNLAGKEA